MWKVGNFSIEPEMNTGDGRALKFIELQPKFRAQLPGAILGGKQPAQQVMGDGQHSIIEALRSRGGRKNDSIALRQGLLNAAAKQHAPATGRDVIDGVPIEL